MRDKSTQIIFTTFTCNNISRQFGNFPGCLETFQAVLKPFQAVWKLSRHLHCFDLIQGSILYMNMRKKLSRCAKNFPGGNATLSHMFFCLCGSALAWKSWKVLIFLELFVFFKPLSRSSKAIFLGLVTRKKLHI